MRKYSILGPAGAGAWESLLGQGGGAYAGRSGEGDEGEKPPRERRRAPLPPNQPSGWAVRILPGEIHGQCEERAHIYSQAERRVCQADEQDDLRAPEQVLRHRGFCGAPGQQVSMLRHRRRGDRGGEALIGCAGKGGDSQAVYQPVFLRKKGVACGHLL